MVLPVATAPLVCRINTAYLVCFDSKFATLINNIQNIAL